MMDSTNCLPHRIQTHQKVSPDVPVRDSGHLGDLGAKTHYDVSSIIPWAGVLDCMQKKQVVEQRASNGTSCLKFWLPRLLAYLLSALVTELQPQPGICPS